MLALLTIFIFIFGLIIGSFLNCLIWRLHTNESMLGRSHCPKCLKQIFWHDNIPVLSFLALGGKCRHCQKKISWQYPVVEFITGVLFVMALFINFLPMQAGEFQISNFEIQSQILGTKFIIALVRDWFIIAVMIIIFIYDLRWYLIMDIVTLPSCLIVFLLNLYLGMSWQNLLFSGIIGSSFFFVQYLISRGKWIGGGDIRLGLLMGLASGWPNIILAIMLAYFIGSIVGIGLILSKKKNLNSKVPLGIFLSTASIITLFWGESIIGWYLGMIGI